MAATYASIRNALSTQGCWHVAAKRTTCSKCSGLIRAGDQTLVFHRRDGDTAVCEWCATGRTRPRLVGPRSFDEAPMGFRG